MMTLYRISTSLVATDLLVLDRQGRSVKGLVATDFVITEDNTPQQVGHFLLGSNSSVPRSIALIIDYSGSQFPFIQNSVDAAKVLIDKLGPRDRMAIITDDIEMLCDFTTSKAELKKKIVRAQPWQKGFLGLVARTAAWIERAIQCVDGHVEEVFDAEDQRPSSSFKLTATKRVLRNSIIVPRSSDLPPEWNCGATDVEAQLSYSATDRVQFGRCLPGGKKSRATIYTVVPGTQFVDLLPSNKWAIAADDERASNQWLPTLSKGARSLRRVTRLRDSLRCRRLSIALRVCKAISINGSFESIRRLDRFSGSANKQSIYSRILRTSRSVTSSAITLRTKSRMANVADQIEIKVILTTVLGRHRMASTLNGAAQSLKC
jgi:hypothetical protein